MSKNESDNESKRCGIIMPIASMDGYTSEHWQEVKSIIVEATSQVANINFKTEIVSDSDGEIDVIHKRIIQNIYNSHIVVCDISGKNPNVLFELGMRLTFDKPTIIIKDDVTDFMFDTGVIEHLTYPKDLRFQKIVDFKKILADRIKKTYEKSLENPAYSTFLGNFGEFTVPDIKQTSISDVEELILGELKSLRTEISTIRKDTHNNKFNSRELSVSMIKELDSAVYKYLDNIQDNYQYTHGDPENIVNDVKFLTFLRESGIDHTQYTKITVVNSIMRAQKEILPF